MIFEKYVKGWVVSSFTGPSKQIIICEWRVSVEDSGEESSDNGNSSSKATIPIKARSKGAHNSCFKEKKRRNKQHYK